MTGFVECRLVSLLSQADCEDELVREAIIALGSFAHGMYVYVMSQFCLPTMGPLEPLHSWPDFNCSSKLHVLLKVHKV